MEDFQKPRYEKPIMFDLGSMAKGSGQAPEDCTAGGSATRDCTAGVTASRNCTAGDSAVGSTCSQGATADPTCTGGTQPAAAGGCIGGTIVI